MKKGNVIVRADGKVLNTGGCCCSAPRPDIPVYSSNRYSASQLPKKVDLRPYMTEIEDQGQINSCTANATVGAFEYLLKTKQNITVDLSRLFVYYNARKAKHWEKKDDGSCICDAVDSLKSVGICLENIWPNQKNLVLKQPNSDCYNQASELLISGCRRVKTSIDDFKLALAEGNPIIFGMALFNSFDRQRKKGFVPMPTGSDVTRGSHGSHAMLCVGYSDVDQVFIVRNSWGKNWGDHGYCYIPYGYLANPKYNGGDNWIIDIPESAHVDDNNVEDNEEEWDNEDTWSNDDESVLTELNDEFAQMDDEQWQAFNEAMGKYDLPYRLGALFAIACVMDDEISDEEREASIEHLKNILKIFNYKMDAEKVFNRCIKLASKDDFLEETVAILGEYLSPGALATIAKNMYEIAGADGLDQEEEEFIDSLVGAWLDTDEELEYNED
ncbi:MAG: hypothetical protein IJU23_02180, partial [Proteobacteria bacterium]|nr:hypothetical protein [Pseudomonadota bacterium]